MSSARGLRPVSLLTAQKQSQEGQLHPHINMNGAGGTGGAAGGEVLIRSFMEYSRLHIANLNSCLLHSNVVTENLKHAFQFKTRMNMDL